MDSSVSDYLINKTDISPVSWLIILDKLQELKGKEGRVVKIPKSFDHLECFQNELNGMSDNFDNASDESKRKFAEGIMVLRYLALDFGLTNRIALYRYYLTDFKVVRVCLDSYYSDEAANQIHVNTFPGNTDQLEFVYNRERLFSEIDGVKNGNFSHWLVDAMSEEELAKIKAMPVVSNTRLTQHDEKWYTFEKNHLKLRSGDTQGLLEILPKVLEKRLAGVYRSWDKPSKRKLPEVKNSDCISDLDLYPFGFSGDTNGLLIPLFTPFIETESSEESYADYTESNCIDIEFEWVNGEYSPGNVVFHSHGDAMIRDTHWCEYFESHIMFLINKFSLSWVEYLKLFSEDKLNDE